MPHVIEQLLLASRRFARHLLPPAHRLPPCPLVASPRPLTDPPIQSPFGGHTARALALCIWIQVIGVAVALFELQLCVLLDHVTPSHARTSPGEGDFAMCAAGRCSTGTRIQHAQTQRWEGGGRAHAGAVAFASQASGVTALFELRLRVLLGYLKLRLLTGRAASNVCDRTMQQRRAHTAGAKAGQMSGAILRTCTLSASTWQASGVCLQSLQLEAVSRPSRCQLIVVQVLDLLLRTL
ncbi:hypothetical protein B0H19DRAFT_1266198 [Mycena capillaripes]|nr:hypothetical protein B0H19DRAFT_1266198 [Mycena capillaripes]